jgi:histidyl-tRNA synthetase
MYTFTDRGDRSLTLRPEGTAAVARAFVGEGMHREPLPVKLWYEMPMFRYEKPQAGRYREHVQIGAEALGSAHPAVDAELIALLHGLYRDLDVPDVRLRINSLGDAEGRPAYREALTSFLAAHESALGAEERERLRLNPLRLFDSKDEAVRAIMADAPRMVDHLSPAAKEHFDEVLALLEAAGVPYELDASLVRGLDYYTHTTFEFACPHLGAQDAVGGGGRYDGLVEQLGGPSTPGVGFGAGIERIMLAMQAGAEAAGTAGADAPTVDAYVCVSDEAASATAFGAVQRLREAGFTTEWDLAGRSMKGQRKQASRLRAAVVVEAGADGLRIDGGAGEDPIPTAIDVIVTDVSSRIEARG